MENFEVYEKSTASAAKALIDCANKYMHELQAFETPIFISSRADESIYKLEYAAWAEREKLDIKAKLEAQEKFCNELFAKSSVSVR